MITYRLRREGSLDDVNSCNCMGDKGHAIKSQKGRCKGRSAYKVCQGENLFQHGFCLTAFGFIFYNEATTYSCHRVMAII